MTVSYTLQVATCTGVGNFWKLLFRWRGSIWKLMWPNLLAFMILVVVVSFVHRLCLNDEQEKNFQKIARKCKRDIDMIPMAFILGFYVNLVITRWWDQYCNMPWPDGMAVYISALIYGQDDRGRLIRRTLIRYCNLTLVLVMRQFSTRMQRRFPSYDQLVDAGLLLANEKVIFEHLDQKTAHPKYWMPLVWAGGIMVRARKEGRVRDDFSLKTLVDALNTYRGECAGMINWDWICIPLVYTQCVTLAVYAFIVTAIVGSQAYDSVSEDYLIYVPVFSFMQLLFYMGWLKVAETLVNPWGDDDDDFEVNWMVDRHLQVSYMIVDEMHQEHPELVKDQYWDEVFPAELPYTPASKPFNTRPVSHQSVFNIGGSLSRRTTGMNTAPSSFIQGGGGGGPRDSGSEDGDSLQSNAGSHEAQETPPITVSPSAVSGILKDPNAKKRRKRRTSTGGSQMLYEADSQGFASEMSIHNYYDPNKPLTQDDIFRMSDESIEKEVQPKTEPEPYVAPVAPYRPSQHTDLKPVDLSAPDSGSALQTGQDNPWTRSNVGLVPGDPWGLPEEQDDPTRDYSFDHYNPRRATKVVIPSGMPVHQSFEDFSTPESTASASDMSPSDTSPSDTSEPWGNDKRVSFYDSSMGPAPGHFARTMSTTRAGTSTTSSIRSRLASRLADFLSLAQVPEPAATGRNPTPGHVNITIEEPERDVDTPGTSRARQTKPPDTDKDENEAGPSSK